MEKVVVGESRWREIRDRRVRPFGPWGWRGRAGFHAQACYRSGPDEASALSGEGWPQKGTRVAKPVGHGNADRKNARGRRRFRSATVCAYLFSVGFCPDA